MTERRRRLARPMTCSSRAVIPMPQNRVARPTPQTRRGARHSRPSSTYRRGHRTNRSPERYGCKNVPMPSADATRSNRGPAPGDGGHPAGALSPRLSDGRPARSVTIVSCPTPPGSHGAATSDPTALFREAMRTRRYACWPGQERRGRRGSVPGIRRSSCPLSSWSWTPQGSGFHTICVMSRQRRWCSMTRSRQRVGFKLMIATASGADVEAKNGRDLL
jgi:hypothetical protein